jgi:hypothetical protein
VTGESNGDEPRRTYNLLVYGIEKKGLKAPTKPITRANYSLHFEGYTTSRRFSDFDGVIVFQGIFENVEYGSGYSGSYVTVSCDKEQLDKRDKESDLLLEQGGIACFLLCDTFVEHANYGCRDASSTDLAKRFLNYDRLRRENFPSRLTSVTAKRNEFTPFLKLYGAASSHFNYYGDEEYQVIAETRNRMVGFSFFGRQFYVPSMVPENTPEKIEEYFCSLADALTSTVNKLVLEVPAWVNTFRFSEEQDVLKRQGELLTELDQTKARLVTFERFKRILIADGDQLVEVVNHVLEVGFGFKVDDTDEYREDLKIVDAESKPLVLVEVKGTNSGVKRAQVSQAGDHRERAKLAADFPSVLIINTHIKNARTLGEKDKPVPDEQIEHAARNEVVVLRTLDLLGLLELVKKGEMSAEKVLTCFKGKGGWLRAWGMAPVLIQERTRDTATAEASARNGGEKG